MKDVAFVLCVALAAALFLWVFMLGGWPLAVLLDALNRWAGLR